MKLIVDESSGAAVAEYLRSMGHNVLAVAEVLPKLTTRISWPRFVDHFSICEGKIGR